MDWGNCEEPWNVAIRIKNTYVFTCTYTHSTHIYFFLFYTLEVHRNDMHTMNPDAGF